MSLEHLLQKRALLVDDDRPVRTEIARQLEQQGVAVSVTASVHEALQQFERQPVPLVLLDTILEDGDGLQLLRQLKARQPQTQLVLVTRYPSLATAVAALREGALDYLVKTSDDLQRLPELVQRAFARVAQEVETSRMLEQARLENQLLARIHQTLEKSEARDPATGLYNRGYFEQALAAETLRAGQAALRFSLVLVNLDPPELADAASDAADRAFAELARQVCGRLRRTDSVARFASRRLAILLPETERSGAERVVTGLRELLAAAPAASAFALSSYPADGTCEASLLDHALGQLPSPGADRCN